MSRRDSYADREHARNRAYKAAYQSEEFTRWAASLTPEQRENAVRLGLLTYQLDKESSGRSVEDLPPSLAPRTKDAPVEDTTNARDAFEGETELAVAQRRMLRSFLMRNNNPELQWACICYLAGNGTCEAHAERLGISKQDFHYHVANAQQLLGITRRAGQRSARARQSYRMMNRRRS